MHHQSKPPEFRHRRRIVAFALAVIVALASGWLIFHRDSPRKVVFPDGTQVTLHRVTWGAAMEVRRPMPLRRWLGNRLASLWSVGLHPLIPLPESQGFPRGGSARIDIMASILGTEPSPAYDEVLEPGHLELVVVQGTNFYPILIEVLDGALVPLEQIGMIPSLPVALHREELRWIDWRAERIRFRIRRGDVEKTVEMPNPRPPSSLRNFRAAPEPLPAVQKVSGFEVRLNGLRAVATRDGRSISWVPDVRFLRGNRDVTAGMQLRFLFEDSDGRVHSRRLLPSEPKWRVRIEAWPKPTLESEESDEFSFPLPHSPAEGEWIPLPDLDSLRPLGIVGGGFSGPGFVSVTNGVRVEPDPEGPPVAGAPQQNGITQDSWFLNCRELHTVLWLALDADRTERPFWLDAGNGGDAWIVIYRGSEGLWTYAQPTIGGRMLSPDRRLVRIELRDAASGRIRLKVHRWLKAAFLIEAPKAAAPPDSQESQKP
jgi:hypothetical protein